MHQCDSTGVTQGRRGFGEESSLLHMPWDAQIKVKSRSNSISHSSFNYTPRCTFCSAVGRLGGTAFDVRVSVENCGQVSNSASTARQPINGARDPAGKSGCLPTLGRRPSPARTRALAGENKHIGYLAVLAAPRPGHPSVTLPFSCPGQAQREVIMRRTASIGSSRRPHGRHVGSTVAGWTS